MNPTSENWTVQYITENNVVIQEYLPWNDQLTFLTGSLPQTLVHMLHLSGQILGVANLHDRLFWGLVNAWFGIISLALQHCSSIKQLSFALVKKLHSDKEDDTGKTMLLYVTILVILFMLKTHPNFAHRPYHEFFP